MDILCLNTQPVVYMNANSGILMLQGTWDGVAQWGETSSNIMMPGCNF